MEPRSYTPGAIYWLMVLLALWLVVGGIALLFGVWTLEDPQDKSKFIFLFFLGVVWLCTLALGWHRFTPREDGLYVDDIRGRRRHRWETLGKARLHEFGNEHARGYFAWSRSEFAGRTDTQSFSHVICAANGRPLYRVGPWYPRRRQLMREVRARIRTSR